jgi:ABC-type oligopeptide transport system substrate-binding subunit
VLIWWAGQIDHCPEIERFGSNASRWSDPEYDNLFETLRSETVEATFVNLNDILISNNMSIPLVQRAAESYERANNSNANMLAGSSWEGLYPNNAKWHEVGQQRV